MAFEETTWRFRSAPESDVERASEGDAMSLRVWEWLAMPEGTIAHHPSWGHNLGRFKHDPMSENSGLEVIIELAIARKMPLDIEDLRLVSVKVEIMDMDLCKVTIVHQYGRDTAEIKL